MIMAGIKQRNTIERCAKGLGLSIETHCPGDGTRKYEFTLPDGKVAGYALGSREAEVFLNGYKAGLDEAERREIEHHKVLLEELSKIRELLALK
jgi:hypothetical protein